MGNSTTKKTYIKTVMRLMALAVFYLYAGTAQAQIPSASFTADTTVGCVPLTVHFTNTSLQATSYFWDFGAGVGTSTLPNPQAVYLAPGFYTVKLIAYNSTSGQSDTLIITNYIQTVAFPTAAFTANTLSGCEDLTVSFTNSSQFASNYIWDFGDGSSSTLTNPTHIYTTPGLYTVKLVAYTTFGCNDILTKPSYINVYARPNATITANPTSTCTANQVIQFSCPTPGITSYQWNFGQPSSGAANTSTLPTPTHTYGAQGSFTVTLIAQNVNGCSDTIVMPNFINIGNALVPTFTIDDSSGCAPHTVNFTAGAITGATSYQWTFGDPASGALNTSTTTNPSHTYSSSGTYSVTLYVTTASGCNGGVTYNNVIDVDQLPNPNFTVTSPTGCAPHSVQFNNTTPSSGSYTYLWEFGDGNTSTSLSPSNVYTTAGTYTVILHAYTANGCEAIISQTNVVTINDITATLSATPLKGCPALPVNFSAVPYPGIVAYSWNFGDPGSGAANTSAAQNPSHTYNNIGTYNVRLIVTSSAGCKDTMLKNSFITVAASPVAYTLPDTIEGCMPLTVNFADPTGASSIWNWQFGDGDSSNVQNPSHVYDTAGVYIVTLTANMYGNSGAGCSQTFQPFAIVNVKPLLLSPITYVQATPCAPYEIHFSDTTGDVAVWDWDFGDGSPHDSTQFPIHNYAQPGTYTVILNITTIFGCMTSISTTITLGIPNPIQASTHATCDDTPINFSLIPNTFSNIVWNFGDGTATSSSATPTHTYNQPGTFLITLTATGADGCNYTYNDTIITEDPQPSYVINGSTTQCNALYVTFTNTSTGATSYLWDFNDIFSPTDTSTAFSPTYFFHNFGQYTVTLTASSAHCSRTITDTAVVNIGHVFPGFTMTQSSFCFPITVQFADTSWPGPNVMWGWNLGDGTVDSTQTPVHTFYTPPPGNVSLWIKDAYGCTGTITKPNITYLSADFSTSASGGCRPYTVTFSDSSDTSAVAWLWDFGDGTSSTQQNPTHTYLNDSVYTITLITTFASGCSDTITYPNLITVSSPHANFSTPTVASCSPAQIFFTNLSSNATSFFWDFGDGATSVVDTPSHVYNIPGDYTVTLIAINGACADTIVKTDYIHIPGSYAYFTLTSNLNCAGNLVTFADSSINAYIQIWNFGDGSVDSTHNPTHLYVDSGIFVVTLITIDSLGCMSYYTYPDSIVVHPSPTANGFTTDTVGCNAYTVNFTETCINETAYAWHFGDGDTSSLANPQHVYQNAGTYYPWLVAINQYGCTDTFYFAYPVNVHQTPTASFTPSVNSGCTTLDVSFTNTSTNLVSPTYFWNFQNGVISMLPNNSTSYADSGAYNVMLVVTNENLCSDTAYQTINVHLTPTAIGATTDTAGCSPYTCTFTNNSVFSDSYLWNFGNTATSTDSTPVYTYTVGGSYTATLIAYNNFGCSDTMVFPYSINVSQTPTAQFTPSTTSGCTNLIVSFTNTSTDTISPLYTWNLGVGGITSVFSPTFTYTDSSVNNISLIVSNGNGCNDTAFATVTVYLSPTANASTTDTSGCTPYTTAFTNLSTTADSYLWVFGDGTTSTDTNATHTYTTGGDYQVYLIAYNSFGCSDTFYLPNTIHALQSPTAAFTASATTGCSGNTFVLNNQSTNTSNPTYSWMIGTIPSADENPSVVLVDPGFYTVTLLVVNDNGCADSIEQQNYLQVYDTIPPPENVIYSVSVLSNTQTEIRWQPSASLDLGAYKIWRLDAATGNYNNVMTINNPLNGNFNLDPRYTDSGLNTLDNTYTYKIQTLDVCSYALPLTALREHTSINISAQQNGTAIDINWTPYGGCSVATYELTRVEVSNGSTALIAILPGTQTSYQDTTLMCPFDYSYQVRATDLCGNPFESFSDTAIAQPQNILAGQQADIVRSTVVNNAYVLTEWTEPTLFPDRVLEYQILRSADTNATNYTIIGAVPAGVYSFDDMNVNVKEYNYYYKVEVINDCHLAGMQSSNSSSILLQSQWQYANARLWWTEYDKWDNGVDHYTVEKYNWDTGQWEVIKTVPGTVTQTEVDE